ncbi:unnamed protein product [Urochloa humidicola]
MSSSLGAMGSLPGKLRSLLVSSKNQLPDPLKNETKLLIQDLEEACALLVDLSTEEAIHTMIKLWRNEMSEMSYDLEDYIDKTTHPCSDQFDVEEFCILVDLARDACKSYHRYNLGSLWPSNPSFMAGGNARVPLLSREVTLTETVGIDETRRELISRVRGNVQHEQGLKLVAIHGPAGVGKTTLAQEVYREIGGEFECRAFVRASGMPDTRWLLRSIISQIQRLQRPSYDYTVQMLIDNLSEYLHQKRYFIVIDGLWEISSWDIISSAFPVVSYCSRILITTDIEEVAMACSGYLSDAIFLVEPLSRDYSAALLNNRVSGYKHELFEQLREHLEDIIRTCCGMPLATISIANILAMQPDNSQLWCQVKGCLSSRLRNNLTSEGVLRELLGLSYDSLSQDLKVCLLYLSMYPEGYTFIKADLLKQWMAEGFISEIHENAEEVAESYFDELVCRGLIQPNHINFSDTIVSYTVHSSMLEVIRFKSIEENFTTVIDYSNTIPDLSAKVRRLSLRYSNAKYATKPEGITLSPVRSLIFYGLAECLTSILEFEVLRVLILELWGDKKELDLSGIGRLFQLRYVQIRTDIVVNLPTKMSGLQYLETLEIYARITTLPSDIVHLPNLLHLCVPDEITLPDGINHMRCLRTLKSFDLTRNSEDNVRSVGEMINLHDLHLTCSTAWSDHLKRNLIALVSSLHKHDKLKSLVLAPGTSMPSMYLDCSSSVSSMPVFLQRLELLPPICIFSRLPEWIGQLQKLCILKIVVTELRKGDVNRISMLRKLTVLSLYVRRPTAERIIFKGSAFPVLKYFKFRCGNLCLSFQVEAMPNLQCLDLEFNAHKGEQYGDMVAGIEHLLNLKVIIVRIGAAPGAEESDRTAAESAFKDTICRHSRPWSFSIGRVDSFIEEVADISDPLGSSPRSGDCTSVQGQTRPDEQRSGLPEKGIAGRREMPVMKYQRSSSSPFSCGLEMRMMACGRSSLSQNFGVASGEGEDAADRPQTDPPAMGDVDVPGYFVGRPANYEEYAQGTPGDYFVGRLQHQQQGLQTTAAAAAEQKKPGFFAKLFPCFVPSRAES